MKAASPTLALNTGAQIPRVGLGVFRAAPGDAYAAVRSATASGYRHIDTAQIYGNEEDVGRAVRECGLPREQLFVTSKLWNDAQDESRVEPAFEASLRRLGLERIDLFLLHWPVPGKRIAAYRVLERLYREGRIGAIGVSNFMPRHLEELLVACSVVPAVNQIEVSPFLQQRELRALCARHGIVVEAYSPLTKGLRLADPVVLRIAAEIQRTPAQVLLRWGLQQGMVVLPKSTRPQRIAANIALFDFELDAAAMQALDALEENLVTGRNPQRVD